MKIILVLLFLIAGVICLTYETQKNNGGVIAPQLTKEGYGGR